MFDLDIEKGEAEEWEIGKERRKGSWSEAMGGFVDGFLNVAGSVVKDVGDEVKRRRKSSGVAVGTRGEGQRRASGDAEIGMPGGFGGGGKFGLMVWHYWGIDSILLNKAPSSKWN